MARVTTIRVDGLRALGEAMRKLDKSVSLRAARAATAAGATIIKKAAKKNVKASPSVDKGDLLASIISKRLGKTEAEFTSEHIVTVRGRGKTTTKKDGTSSTTLGAPHAHLVEFGTVNMPAEPYLRPAFEAEKGNAVTAMAAKLKTAIDKAGK